MQCYSMSNKDLGGQNCPSLFKRAECLHESLHQLAVVFQHLDSCGLHLQPWIVDMLSVMLAFSVAVVLCNQARGFGCSLSHKANVSLASFPEVSFVHESHQPHLIIPHPVLRTMTGSLAQRTSMLLQRANVDVTFYDQKNMTTV